jgi:glutathione S-transferase
VYSSKERTSDFLRLNPFGQIPVLEDEGVTIAESIAILEYLEERYPTPALMPTGVVDRDNSGAGLRGVGRRGHRSLV